MKRTRTLARAAALAAAALLGAHAGAMPAAAMPVLLSEVLYDAVGADDGGVFVELSGAPGADLDGYVLEGVNGADGSVTVSVTLSGTVGADGLFLLADTPSSGSSPFSGADLLDDFDLQNGPDSVVLRDASGTVVDALGYGAFGPGDTFAGEGSPAPDAPPGSSLARPFADLDSDDNAADFVVDDPTPGTAHYTVSEPPAGRLLLAGLAAAACLGLARARFGRGVRPALAAPETGRPAP